MTSSILVLDASSEVQIVEGSSQAAAFQLATSDFELILAPQLILTEVLSAIRPLQRAGLLQAFGLQPCQGLWWLDSAMG